METANRNEIAKAARRHVRCCPLLTRTAGGVRSACEHEADSNRYRMMSIADTSASLNSAPTVLLVEDEEALQEIVYDALEEGAFDLTTVSFGRKPWR
jgi:hypothetical protein